MGSIIAVGFIKISPEVFPSVTRQLFKFSPELFLFKCDESVQFVFVDLVLGVGIRSVFVPFRQKQGSFGNLVLEPDIVPEGLVEMN